MTEVHVLWWIWKDGSAAGVLRAYHDKERAKQDLELLQPEDGRLYTITTVQIYPRVEVGAVG